MHSFLITGGTEKSRLQRAQDICLEHGVDPLDQKIYGNQPSNEAKSKDEQTGIKLIRFIQQDLMLKPYAGKTKAVIIQEADLLSIPAQNALLKVLEEPPANTIIILTTKNRETLLGTMQSRCKIITQDSEILHLTDQEISGFHSFLENLEDASPGKKLKLIETVLKDADSSNYLSKLIYYARGLLKTSVQNRQDEEVIKYAKILEKATRTHATLTTTNVNQRLAFEHLLFSL